MHCDEAEQLSYEQEDKDHTLWLHRIYKDFGTKLAIEFIAKEKNKILSMYKALILFLLLAAEKPC